MILDRFPFPPRDGGSYTVCAHAEALGENWDIDLMAVPRQGQSPGDERHPGQSVFRERIHPPVPPIAWKGTRILDELLGRRAFFMDPAPPPQLLAEYLGRRRYDVIYVSPTRIAEWALSAACTLPHRPRLVLGLWDALTESFRRYLDLSRLSGIPRTTRLAYFAAGIRSFRLAAFERQLLDPFDVILVQTRRDAEAVVADCGARFESRLLVVPNGFKELLLDVPYEAAERKKVIYLGAASGGRRDLLFWFLDRVYLPVKRLQPEVTFRISGRVSEADRRLLQSYPEVEVTGFVEDLRDVFRGASLAVAPLFMRCGLVTKVVDAMAAGVPCSGIRAFNGIEGWKDGVHGFAAESAEHWQRMLVRTLQEPDLLRSVSVQARELVRGKLPWKHTLGRLCARLAGLLSSPVPALSRCPVP